ncbi:MAG: lipid IV(A) 3-deoxy-D-manno-octulosonic acid transferase [Gammaproteobacteria bacterium]|nr:lipid IV(A) 3-deoxy-D-manno-octulosonic acid transferase [Gammaproteobacteria bacterium]
MAVRFLYTLALSLLLPFAFVWMFWRTLRQTGHADKLGERFGSSPYLPRNEIIWLHGASMGEVRAMAPLVKALHREYPKHPLLVTSFTGSGRTQAQALFGAQALVAQLPYDLPFCVNRWLTCVSPVMGIVMETEIWPNLFAACTRRQIPLLLVSARLSERGLERFRRVPRLVRAALTQVTAIAAQTAADAEGFQQLGAPQDRLSVMGNLKFDVQLPDTLKQEGRSLRAKLFGKAMVMVAGSTREGEEAQVLTAYRSLLDKHPDCVLVLAPRHPERTNSVAELIKGQGHVCRRRSAGELPLKPGEVLLLDTLGELTHFYAAGHVAFVGGSLVPVGGHNLLEPAAMGLPVLAGPNLDNVRDVAEMLKDAGGLIVVNDAHNLGEAFVWLVGNPGTRQHIGQAAQQTVIANRGALDKALKLIGLVLARK